VRLRGADAPRASSRRHHLWRKCRLLATARGAPDCKTDILGKPGTRNRKATSSKALGCRLVQPRHGRLLWAKHSSAVLCGLLFVRSPIPVHHLFTNVLGIAHWRVPARAAVRTSSPAAAPIPRGVVWTRTAAGIRGDRLANDLPFDFVRGRRLWPFRQSNGSEQRHQHDEWFGAKVPPGTGAQ
jgi:hypothetical protein